MNADFAECQRVLAVHSKSFHLASRLFPRARRDEVAAVYAWCRACDDAIDLAPPDQHAAALAGLRERLASIYAGETQEGVVSRCFQHVVKLRGIPSVYPEELLAGMEMDVEARDYETIDDLLVYCHRVAGVVGLMMCHVMGVSDERATPHAAHLGVAMQLTNICRDVLEDWGRGRVYVPAELLSDGLESAMRAHPGGPLPEKAGPELAAAAQRLLALAHRYYASADSGLSYLEPRSALAVRTARLVYAEIGNEIERRGFDVLAGRAVVRTRTKLGLAARALGRFARESFSRERRRLAVRAPQRLLARGDAIRLPS